MALTVGSIAPDFNLMTDNFHEVKLTDFAGKKIVLYFYPKDQTPGCTKQACFFRDKYSEFSEHNTIILGVSKDTPISHEKFKKKYNLPFLLLSDPSGDVCVAYGVLDKKSLFGKTFLGIKRSTFLINEYQKIEHIWPKVKIDSHIDEVLNVIKASE